MLNVFKKNKAVLSAKVPAVGMKVSHIYGEFGMGSATIVKINGDKLIVDAHKGALTERKTYKHVIIPATRYGAKREYYERTDQQGLVFSEKVFI